MNEDRKVLIRKLNEFKKTLDLRRKKILEAIDSENIIEVRFNAAALRFEIELIEAEMLVQR